MNRRRRCSPNRISSPRRSSRRARQNRGQRHPIPIYCRGRKARQMAAANQLGNRLRSQPPIRLIQFPSGRRLLKSISQSTVQAKIKIIVPAYDPMIRRPQWLRRPFGRGSEKGAQQLLQRSLSLGPAWSVWAFSAQNILGRWKQRSRRKLPLTKSRCQPKRFHKGWKLSRHSPYRENSRLPNQPKFTVGRPKTQHWSPNSSRGLKSTLSVPAAVG